MEKIKKFGILALFFVISSIPLFVASFLLFNIAGFVILILALIFLVLSIVFGYLFITRSYREISKNQIKKTNVNIKYLKISSFIAVSLLILFSFIFGYFIRPVIVETSQPYSFGLLYDNSLASVFWGILFCVAYARFYKKIPGTKTSKKGVVLGLLFWLIISIIIGLFIKILLGIMPFHSINYNIVISFSLFSLFYWLLIGFIVGKIWDRYIITSPSVF